MRKLNDCAPARETITLNDRSAPNETEIIHFFSIGPSFSQSGLFMHLMASLDQPFSVKTISVTVEFVKQIIRMGSGLKRCEEIIDYELNSCIERSKCKNKSRK